jgi:hypothetical protein
MAAHDPVDTRAPWTVKAISTRTRNAMIAAARGKGITVAQWVERRVAEWEDAGSPVPALRPTKPAGQASLGDLVDLIREVRALADAAGVAVPPQFARDALALVEHATREARARLADHPAANAD